MKQTNKTGTTNNYLSKEGRKENMKENNSIFSTLETIENHSLHLLDIARLETIENHSYYGMSFDCEEWHNERQKFYDSVFVNEKDENEKTKDSKQIIKKAENSKTVKSGMALKPDERHAERFKKYNDIFGTIPAKTPEEIHKEKEILYNAMWGHEIYCHVDTIEQYETAQEFFNDWISYNIETITKTVIKKMCFAYNPKTGTRISMNYDSLHKIISTNYTEPLFYDLMQEVAIVLIENIEKLKIVNFIYIKNHCAESDIYTVNWVWFFPDIFKTVRKYLYAQKTNQLVLDEKLDIITGINEYSQNDILMRLDSNEYNQNILDNCELSYTLEIFSSYLEEHANFDFSSKQYDTCLKVWHGMQEYSTQKAISSAYKIPYSTVNLYHKYIVQKYFDFINDGLYMSHYGMTEKQFLAIQKHMKTWIIDTEKEYKKPSIFKSVSPECETLETTKIYDSDHCESVEMKYNPEKYKPFTIGYKQELYKYEKCEEKHKTDIIFPDYTRYFPSVVKDNEKHGIYEVLYNQIF